MADKDWIVIAQKTDGAVWDKENPIEGELIKAQDNVGANHSWLYTLLTEDGEVNVWGSTVLDSRLQELSVGDQVRITPLGKKKSKSGNREYMDYEVAYQPGNKSGYEQAKQQASILRDEDEPLPLEPSEGFDSLEDEPINLDDIPF